MTLSSPPSPLRFETISFLSDYGLEDEFVGVVKSVVRSLAPDVMVIDITHNIAPHDVRAGGLALARASQYLAPGVVIAVVDPGSVAARPAVALEWYGHRTRPPDMGASLQRFNGVALPPRALATPIFTGHSLYGAAALLRRASSPGWAYSFSASNCAIWAPISTSSVTPGLIPARHEDPAISRSLWFRYGKRLTSSHDSLRGSSFFSRTRSVRRAVLASTYHNSQRASSSRCHPMGSFVGSIAAPLRRLRSRPVTKYASA